MKPERAPHKWADPDVAQVDGRGRTLPVYVIARWWWLEPAADPGAPPSLVQSPRRAYGRQRVCVRCGVVAVYAEFHVGDGCWSTQPLYGVDLDSLTPMHAAPVCAPGLLSRPDVQLAAEAA